MTNSNQRGPGMTIALIFVITLAVAAWRNPKAIREVCAACGMRPPNEVVSQVGEQRREPAKDDRWP